MSVNVSYQKRGSGSIDYWDLSYETLAEAREAAEQTVDDGEATEATIMCGELYAAYDGSWDVDGPDDDGEAWSGGFAENH